MVEHPREGEPAVAGATIQIECYEFECPYCGRLAVIGVELPLRVLHEVPMCPAFAELGGEGYAAAVIPFLVRD
jgi:hypothetical protein